MVGPRRGRRGWSGSAATLLRCEALTRPIRTTATWHPSGVPSAADLHEQHGFDVLVFESGLYDVSKVWQAIRTGAPAHEAFKQGIFPAWSRPAEVRPLMDYLSKQAHGPTPLELAGYDAQFSGSASYDHLRDDLSAFLDTLGVGGAFADDSVLWQGLRSIHPKDWYRGVGSTRPSIDVALLLSRLARVQDAVGDRATDDEGRFWLQVLESTAAFARQTALQAADADGKNWAPLFNLRDEQGARNLLWLANGRYRNRKLIVWLATMHAARNVSGIMTDNTDLRGVLPTGHHVWEALGPAMYTMAMVALEGESGWPDDKQRIVENQLPDAELEEMLGEAGFDVAFLDYRTIPPGGEWLRGPLASRPLGNRAMRARSWPDVVDGLLFVRHGKPVTFSEPGR
jgi:erythromycin esterase